MMGVPFLLGHLHRNNLILEASGFDGLLRLALALQGKGVLLFPAEVELFRHVFGGDAHMGVTEGAGEAIVDHGIEELAVAHALAPTGLGQHKGRLAHGLHAPGHDDLRIPGPDGLSGHDDRLQPGAADHVHRHRRGVLGDAGIGGRLAGRVLTLAGLQHIAHKHLVHFFRAEPWRVAKLL